MKVLVCCKIGEAILMIEPVMKMVDKEEEREEKKRT